MSLQPAYESQVDWNLDLVLKAKAPKLGAAYADWTDAVVKRLLSLLLLLTVSTAWSDSGYYRVEVIVFRNLAVTAEAAEVDTLRSFSAFPALVKPVLPIPQIPVTVTEANEMAVEPPEETASTPETDIETAAPPRFDLPDDLSVISDKSQAVDDAWRRLRGSANYRPLLYAAWEQNRVDYYPPIRIHDQQLLATELRPPTQFMLADLTVSDPLAAYRSALYQLDGSVQLRRSRFLHLFLDLEFREAQPKADALSAGPGQYRVYSIKQNRQIHTGRMQYFDTPQFGVLVLVTALKPG